MRLVKCILLLCLLFPFSLGAQSLQNIPGTKLSMQVPAGFTPATGFVGLQKGAAAMIQVYDLVGGNYYTNAATFSKEKFEGRGMKVFEYKEMKINGYPAKFIFMEATGGNHAYSLVFGDTTFSVMIMSAFPAGDKATEDDVRAALMGVIYNKNFKVDPFASAAFTLDDSKSTFKFAKTAAALFIYTIGGKDKESMGDDPMVLVTTLPAEPGTTAEQEAQVMSGGMENNGIKISERKNISTAKVNGYEAYEYELYGKSKGEDILIYQLIVMHRNKAIAIQGIARNFFQDNLEAFKKLAKTVKVK